VGKDSPATRGIALAVSSAVEKHFVTASSEDRAEGEFLSKLQGFGDKQSQ
jgi:hypothetical protein